MSSTTGMKKRKLDEISNTKPAEAKKIKSKLAQAVTQSSTTLKKNQRERSSNNDANGSVNKGGLKSNGKNRSSSRVGKESDKNMTMIDTTTTVKKNSKNKKSSTDKAKKNRVSQKRDPAMEDDDEVEKTNKTVATTDKKARKKVLKEEDMQDMVEDDNNDDETLLTQSQVIIGNMFSLYALAEKQPTKIKPVLDQIFSHDDNSEEFVVKTMFLYFMELMGISDVTTLQYNAQYIAKNSEEKKLLELFNNQEDKLEVSFDKLIFFSQEKKALEQKKLLKRICKIFIANVVDLLPDKTSYLSSVIQRVCVYSKAQQRLTRYSFTYVGLYLFKFLLGQQSELLKLKKNYQDRQRQEENLQQSKEAKMTSKRVASIENAIEIINKNVQTIQHHIIMKRHQDATSIVRKSVYEFLLQLDDKELQIAFGSQNSNSDLYKMIFNALSDEDNQIKKIALNMVYAIITKVDTDDNVEDIITQHLERYKLDIFKLAIPTDKHQDTFIMVKSIQVIQKMIKMNTDIYNNEHKQMISNLVHYKNQSVREEIGEYLLTISDEFEDDAKLLDLQKISPQKGVPEGFTLNFNEQPGKSRKQLLKLIKVFEKHVQTRSQYLTQHKKADDSEEINIPNMGSQEVQRILACDCEERAILLFQTFMKKTSILYDVQSIVALLKRDDIEEDTKVVLSNLINASLSLTMTMKNMKECNNLIYSKLWENQTAYLKLTVMNELLQTFRVQPRILEPLLRSLLAISKCIEKDNQAEINDELGKDYSHLLLRIIEQTDIDEKHPESLQIIKASILSLSQLQIYFPLMRKDIQDLGLNFCEQLQQQIVPKLFSEKASNDEGIQNEVFSFLQKLNVLMTQLSIQKISDSEHLKSLASFAIVNLGQMIIDNYHIISKLTKTQFSCVLQVPFSFIDQLFLDNQTGREHQEFQKKMMHTLMDMYQDLHKQFKSDEARQVIVLRFLVETLIMAGGENRIINANKNMNSLQNIVVMGINEFPRVKELIIDTIQNVSGRMKGNETVIIDQYHILYNLFIRDFQSLLSEIGVEFLINFGISKNQMVASSIRKLYYTYKQKDYIYDQRKTIFYPFVLKIIYTIYQSSDNKIYKLQEQAPGDLEKERKSLGFDDLKIPISLQTYQKLAFIQQFLKTVQNSIMLLVINQKSQNLNSTSNNAHQNGLTKQQDEFAYFKLIEGVIRLSLQDKPNNLPFLLSIKYLMHKNFLQLKQQEGTLKGLRTYIDSNKEALNITHDEMEMIECIVQLIEDKVKQKKNVGNQTKRSINASANNSVDISNQAIQQAGVGSKSKIDATMNLSLTNHNIEQQNTPGKPDLENDQNENEMNNDNKIIEENKVISETKNLIGQKRKTTNRGSSKQSNNLISKSRSSNIDNTDSDDEYNNERESGKKISRQRNQNNISSKIEKENLETKKNSRNSDKKMNEIKSPANNAKARQTSSNPRKQKKVK